MQQELPADADSRGVTPTGAERSVAHLLSTGSCTAGWGLHHRQLAVQQELPAIADSSGVTSTGAER